MNTLTPLSPHLLAGYKIQQAFAADLVGNVTKEQKELLESNLCESLE